ncbi:MAG: hypothetical protein HY791_25085 [Deltaproteobacteria bacterium]|nr:hypothetical protein [Deltaproteobacteria bacterium]
MSSELFGGLSQLESVLDFAASRQDVLATNVAHAETPGYEAKDLTFAATLASVSEPVATNPGHITNEGAEHQLEPLPSLGIEDAMARLAANKLRYETAAELTSRRIALLKYGATDGGMA